MTGSSAEAGTGTVQDALRAAVARGLDRLDSQLLMAHALHRTRSWVIAHADDALPRDGGLAFQALVDRRAAGEPFAYLVGEREFHGLRLAVDAAVLVPRPDTETLVGWALEQLAGPLGSIARPRVVDLGTGSGAIALAIKAACPHAEVWAVERSPAALAVASTNAQRLRLDVRFAQGDWWRALDALASPPRFDLAVSNPPYIAPDDPHLPALAHEPLEALVAAEGGLADLRAIAEGAPGRLADGGRLLFEHGWQQGDAVRDVLAAAGFADIETRLDLEQRPRCTGGRIMRASEHANTRF